MVGYLHQTNRGMGLWTIEYLGIFPQMTALLLIACPHLPTGMHPEASCVRTPTNEWIDFVSLIYASHYSPTMVFSKHMRIVCGSKIRFVFLITTLFGTSQYLATGHPLSPYLPNIPNVIWNWNEKYQEVNISISINSIACGHLLDSHGTKTGHPNFLTAYHHIFPLVIKHDLLEKPPLSFMIPPCKCPFSSSRRYPIRYPMKSYQILALLPMDLYIDIHWCSLSITLNPSWNLT